MRKPLLFLFALAGLIVFAHVGNAQMIYTYAGTGTSGTTVSGVPATAANCFSPSGIAIDDTGNVYFSDQNGGAILKVNAATGIIVTIAGNGAHAFGGDGGPATAAELFWPEGVAVDRFGNVYIADQNNDVIRKVNPAGIISTIAGTPGVEGYCGDGGPATNGCMHKPDDVGVDYIGNIYALDQDNHCVRKIDAVTGIISTWVGDGTGTPGFAGDGGPATTAELNFPGGMYVDSAGDIYIADLYNGRVRYINGATGIITSIAGNGSLVYAGDGGPATMASLDEPCAVTADKIGNVYIDVQNGSRIMKLFPNGLINTIAGDGNAGYNGDGILADSAELCFPEGTGVDASGNIYSADFCNSRVRVIKDVPTTAILPPVMGLDTVCIGYSAELSDSVRIFIDTAFFNWSAGGSWSSGNTAVATIDSISGVYTGVSAGSDVITYSSSAYGIFITTTVTVVAPPNAGTIVGPASLCIDSTIDFSESLTTGAWGSSDTAVCKVNTEGNVKCLSAGTAIISYTVSNGYCSSVAMKTVTVTACPSGIRNIGSPSVPDLEVFPNPNQGAFSVVLYAPIQEDAQIKITNLLGEVIIEFPIATNKTKVINLDTPPGTYYLSAFSSSGKLNTMVTVQ